MNTSSNNLYWFIGGSIIIFLIIIILFIIFMIYEKNNSIYDHDTRLKRHLDLLNISPTHYAAFYNKKLIRLD